MCVCELYLPFLIGVVVPRLLDVDSSSCFFLNIVDKYLNY